MVSLAPSRSTAADFLHEVSALSGQFDGHNLADLTKALARFGSRVFERILIQVAGPHHGGEGCTLRLDLREPVVALQLIDGPCLQMTITTADPSNQLLFRIGRHAIVLVPERRQLAFRTLDKVHATLVFF